MSGPTGQQRGTVKRRWTPVEDGVLIAFYGAIGAIGCARLLVGRGAGTVRVRALRLKLRKDVRARVLRPVADNPTPLPARDAHADAYLAWQVVDRTIAGLTWPRATL